MNDQLVFRSASELAQMVRQKAVSSEDVVAAHLVHIEHYNQRLNAIVCLNENNALVSARKADAALAHGELWGPLHGVPITVKDSLETAGITTTSSYRPLSGYVPHRNAAAVQRLLDAGAVVLGKTNLPELAMQVQTNSRLHGRANNPWDLSRTPGGSTGGGAAAVAAGLSPLEIGSDLTGSLRIPAHFCGIVGHKPTANCVSLEGHIPPLPGHPKTLLGTAVVGPLARDVDDLILTMKLLYGTGLRDLNVPAQTADEEVPTSLEGLRIAWYDDFAGVPVTQDTIDGLAVLSGKLRSEGCEVEWVSPPSLDFEQLWQAFGRIVGSGLAASMPVAKRYLSRVLGKWAMRDDPMFSHILRGFDLNMRRYYEALQYRQQLIESTASFFDEWDAWLCPVSSTPAVPHQTRRQTAPYKPISVDGVDVPYWTAGIAYTSVASFLGNPVTVIPLTRTEEGLPIGVQVMGKPWKDIRTLAIAKLVMGLTRTWSALQPLNHRNVLSRV